jgi:two-component system, cell cycle response regulator
MKVVVAHGSATARERYASVLAGVGHAVTTAAGPEEALERCREDTPDVILLDDALCAAGHRLLETLKSDIEAYRAAIVLVERPDLNLAHAVSALERGVDDFLVEPAPDAELVARVRAAARTKGLQHELVSQSRRMEALIFEDSLTGLFNRRFILTQLSGLVSGARRHEHRLAVVMIDIDHFKLVNDQHGHAAGDRVLVEVAGALRRNLRAEDHLGRLGGEEFLAVLPDTDAEAAQAAAEKLREAVAAARVEHDGLELAVTVSVGWAAWEGETAEDLVRRADEALYAAKRLGRDQACGAPASLHRRR